MPWKDIHNKLCENAGYKPAWTEKFQFCGKRLYMSVCVCVYERGEMTEKNIFNL